MPSIPVTIIGHMHYTELGVGGGPVFPSSPGSPPGIWGGAPLPWPTPPIYYPPGIWPSPGHPAHPIAPGGPPPGIWPPGSGIDMPAHPIVLPPGTIPGLKPEHPIYIPPPAPGVPAHPIVLPPPGSPDKPEVLENWDVKTYWTPTTGWAVAIVPSESHPGTPTPSAGRRG